MNNKDQIDADFVVTAHRTSPSTETQEESHLNGITEWRPRGDSPWLTFQFQTGNIGPHLNTDVRYEPISDRLQTRDW